MRWSFGIFKRILLSRRHANVLANEGAVFMDVIVEGEQRMQTRVQDLLTYSRPGMEDLPDSIETDTAAVLERVLRGLESLVRDSGVSVDVGQPLLPLPITEFHLSRILHNLICNAGATMNRPAFASKRTDTTKAGSFACPITELASRPSIANECSDYSSASSNLRHRAPGWGSQFASG